MKRDLSHLRKFTARCGNKVIEQCIRKLGARAQELVMIGYAKRTHGCKPCDVADLKVLVLRNVTVTI